MTPHEGEAHGKREVVSHKTFPQLIFEVANRTVSFHDFQQGNALAVLPEAGEKGIQAAEAGAYLQHMICDQLAAGKIVVANIANGGLDKSVIGLRNTTQGVEAYTASRHLGREPVYPSRHFFLRELDIVARFDPKAQVLLQVSDASDLSNGETIAAFVVSFSPREGRYAAILSAEVKQTESVQEPVLRDVENRYLVGNTHVRLDAHGRLVVEKYEYHWEKETISMHDEEGFVLRSESVTDITVLAASGFIQSPWSSMKPSGWFVQGQDSGLV